MAYGALTSAVGSFGGVGEAWKAYKSYQEGSPVQPPKISTGTSVVPYTGGGAVAGVGGGEVQQMGPFESMMVILEDIRDGTYGIIDKIQDMIVDGIPTWEKGEPGVEAARLAARQTGRSETEGGGGKSFGILTSIGDAFKGLMPEGGFGDKLKILAFAGALWALSKWSDEIVPVVAKIVEFTKTKLLPMLMKVLDFIGVTDEEGNISWKKLLGMGLAAYVALKVGPALLGLVFKVPGGATVLGLTALAVWATASIFQIAGDWAAAKDWNEEMGASDNETLNKIAGGLAGDLEGGMWNALKNASKWAGIGATTGMLAGGPVGMLIGMVIGGAIGGILGWIGGGKIAQAMDWVVDGFNNMWKSVTTAISDIFYDREVTTMVAGKEMKHIKRSKVGAMADSMRELEKSINEWMDNAFEKMFGWIPTKAEITETWTDMTTKVDDWKKDMVTWFDDMWDKLTGWIPSVADIKAAGGDMLQWTKDIIKDIKLWFWDTSKPQIIGIDLSSLAAAMPSAEDLKAAIFSVLPEWLQPDSIEEAHQKFLLKETKASGFFEKDYSGSLDKSDIDRSKIGETSAEQLKAILALEGDDLSEKDIAWIKERIKIKTGTDWATARQMMTSPSASGQALAEVSGAFRKHGHPGGGVAVIDAKTVTSTVKGGDTIVEASAQDNDPVTGIVYPRFGSLLAMQRGY